MFYILPMIPRPNALKRIAIEDLGLEHLWVIYPGHQEYPLDDKISVIPMASLPRFVNSLHFKRAVSSRTAARLLLLRYFEDLTRRRL